MSILSFKAIPRILIAAAQSGSGKTTIVTGIIAALKRRGFRVCACKTGPDYIDPGYHRLAGAERSLNLDTWMTDSSVMTALFSEAAECCDIAVIEGVMGLYDGGLNGVSSSAEIAKMLSSPVLLVIDSKSMGDSAAAVALGFREYDREVDLQGVILNRLGSDNHRNIITSAMERLGIPVLGAIKRDEKLNIPERQLGLTPAEESRNLDIIALMRETVENGLNLDAIIEAARAAAPLSVPPMPACDPFAQGVKIAVAHDEAFSFYYPESLSALSKRGAELVFFSPLKDDSLPEADGLILGGGFPELFACGLSANIKMKESIVAAANAGMPIFAECGGFMYLTDSIRTLQGDEFKMVGLIPGKCFINDKLQTVGYVEAEALTDTAICPIGTVIRGHEFHFSSFEPDRPEAFPWAFSFTRRRTGAVYPGGCSSGNLLASYLHLNFAGNGRLAEGFLRKAMVYREIS